MNPNINIFGIAGFPCPRQQKQLRVAGVRQMQASSFPIR